MSQTLTFALQSMIVEENSATAVYEGAEPNLHSFGGKVGLARLYSRGSAPVARIQDLSGAKHVLLSPGKGSLC